ncbi:MAG: OB-fold domain-containing protein [Afipia sp.]|nr:OB-fold domain-containing protein [Afipia sp.]
MSEATDLKGWNDGVDAILYQSCGACRHLWYFRRGFCPSCGDASPQTHKASGNGVVYSATLVRRAATPETRALVPYAILLVDMAEGFRMMAHGDIDLRIGDHVVAEFRPFTGLRMPYFVKA